MLLPGTWRISWWACSRAWRRGAFDRAIRIARFFVKIRPRYPQAWLLLGTSLDRAGECEEAENALRRGLALEPHNTSISYTLAGVFIRLSRLDEADRILNQILERNPQIPDLHIGLAEVALARNDHRQAHVHAHKALELIPQSDHESQSRVAALLLEIPEDRRDAESVLLRLSRSFPRDPHPHLMLAVLLEHRDPQGASQHLDLARRSWKGHPSLMDAYLKDLRGSLHG